MLDSIRLIASNLLERMTLIWLEVSGILQAIFEFPVHIVTLQGQMRGGKDQDHITLLYIGRRSNLAHLKNKFFKEATTVRSIKSSLLTYQKHLDQPDATNDVVFVDIGWPYHRRINKNDDYLELPIWVHMVAPIADTWDDTLQNFRKTMRKNINRLIRKNDYQCETTNDPRSVKTFYDEYYRTYINSRYSDEVYMTPRIIVEARARRGVILKVMGQDGPVAGGVYFPSGNELRLLVTGMPETLVENPPEAALSALYFFSLRYAFENGYKAVNLLGTRCFPNDGLFQFKRKWGAIVKDDYSIDSLLFKPANDNARAARFCELFPMIARKGKCLELVLCTTAQDLRQDDCNLLVANAHCDGLDPVRIVHLTHQNTDEVRPGAAGQPKVNMVRTTSATFQQSYTGSIPNTNETPDVGGVNFRQRMQGHIAASARTSKQNRQ